MRTIRRDERRTGPRRRRPLLAMLAAIIATALLALAAPAVVSAAPTSSPSAVSAAKPRTTAAKPTIVLVHGAWAGASSFDPVTTILQAQGYTVVSANVPMRAMEDDINQVVSYVSTLHPEPVVLVGHSYGGFVITGAASRLPNVKGLVYIDAFAPKAGESIVSLAQGSGSLLDVGTDYAKAFDIVPHPGQDGAGPDFYLRVDRFREIIAAGVPSVVTKVLAADQSPIAGSVLETPFNGPAAWESLPSWYFVGTDDKVIPAAGQRQMAQRAGSTIVEGRAPHLAMYGAPLKVSQLIVSAARAVG
ncbi:alpha/beta fold hydrolase [Microbacterium wangruii]|uniref:alpha/beta fold hydrolase n=1 Tax=Microbacterium wangruii TaxID=3049073 RepID=UPI00256F0D0D|nr:alpha/beta hydrolase [Microbacterium sp. zg-Y1211]MDL5486832.1 alpha/beta hydrolase [Microbacterium sp. zg-Y1211]